MKFKKTIAVSLAALLASTSAQAGSIVVKKDVPLLVPVQKEKDATSFYLGLSGASALKSFRNSDSADNLKKVKESTFYEPAVALGGGVFAGANFYVTSDVFVAPELELQYHYLAKAKGVKVAEEGSDKSKVESASTVNPTYIKHHLDGTLRVRVGYEVNGFKPYAALGLGTAYVHRDQELANTSPKTKKIEEASLELGLAASAGLEYAINDNVSVRGEYRLSKPLVFYSLKDNGLAELKHMSVTSHEVRLGVAYKF